MQGTRGGKKGRQLASLAAGHIKLLLGMALALMVVSVLIMAAEPGSVDDDRTMLSQSLLSGRSELNIDSEDLASRVLEQKFQIHMEEMDQQMGEIPYVEVWVLNDPFYPLMGLVGSLRTEEGALANKQWQMLGFPDYQADTGGGTAPPTTSAPGSSLPVTTGVTQRVVMVQEIYEIRGIRYATIKVNEEIFDKLKAGSDFAEVFKVQEIKDSQTVVVLCGDESYELKVNQLRKL